MTREIPFAILYANKMATTQTLCTSDYSALKAKTRDRGSWLKLEEDQKNFKEKEKEKQKPNLKPRYTDTQGKSFWQSDRMKSHKGNHKGTESR